MQVPPRYHGFRGRFKRLKENNFFSKTNPQSLPRQTVRLQKKQKTKPSSQQDVSYIVTN